MRELILYHIYSGDIWFSAGGLLLIATAVDMALRGERYELQRRALRIGFILSVPLGALAGVPLSPWITGPLLLVWMAYLMVGFSAARRVTGVATGAAVMILAVLAMTIELDWRMKSDETSSPPTHLFVFGDSLSSGGFGEERSWVERLDDRLLVRFTNLSRPSATVGSALRFQLPEMERCDDCGVIIELGGNDMLGGGSAIEMKADLLTLVEGVRERGAERIWLVELPIPLGKWKWAASQRHVVDRTGVSVIPRRALATMLSDPEGTSDGLHPTSRGHEILADRIESLLE